MQQKGAMGVFTKCAVKLYPWPGPKVLPVEGKAPAYRANLPKNFAAYTLAFPNWQAYSDAAHKIWDAGIGYAIHRQFTLFGRDLKGAVLRIVSDHTKTMDDLENMVKIDEIKKENAERKHDFEIVVVGMTPRDMEWQEESLDQILSETGGWKMKVSPERAQWMLLYFIRLGHKGLNHFTGRHFRQRFGAIWTAKLRHTAYRRNG